MRLAPLAIVLLTACEPALDARLSLIETPTVIAVVADPAEAAPGDPVTYAAIVAAPTGVDGGAPTWAFCAAPKPPTEDNVVSPACLGELPALAVGAMLDAVLPLDGSRRFGPEPPPEGGRPRDPDATGGYYQPLRATLPDGALSFGLHRLDCALANAPASIARQFRERYVRNRNPGVPVLARVDGAPVTAPVAAGAAISLEASWSPDDAEPFVAYDLAAGTLVDRREAMRVSWYVTAGSLAVDTSGVAEGAAGRAAANTFTAPSTPGEVTLWIILRDSRGGASAATTTFTVAS